MAASRPAPSRRRSSDNEQLPEDHPVARAARRADRRPRCSSSRCSCRPRCRCESSRRSSTATRRPLVRQSRRQRHPPVTGTPQRIRTDLSATLFLAEPDEYDGGELIVEDTYGVHSVKLPAGHLVLYPSTSLHRVEPVTRGARIASFFWIQSMVRDDGARTLLFDLDTAIQRLTADVPTIRRSCSSPRCITTSCAAGPSFSRSDRERCSRRASSTADRISSLET